MNNTRRRILFAGVGGALLLGAASLLEAPARKVRDSDRATTGALPADGADVMRALIPALLAGALPRDAVKRERAIGDTLDGVAVAFAGLAPVAREELASLYALLAWAPLRWVLGGTLLSLRDMTPADADAFLDGLRASRWSKKRAAYDALHQITFAAWYANPASWLAIGYPGPPSLS